MTALFDAIRQGDTAQVQVLLAENPALAQARNQDGSTAVQWSIYTRHAELAPLLLGAREPDFFEACALGRLERVEALLAADPGLATAHAADGFSGLGLAIFFGHTRVARRMVAAGADVNAPSRNTFRVAPLHSAVESGKPELVELLLAHGARPDPVEFLDATPLHSAAAKGNVAMVEQLLAAGADRSRKTKDGRTAADLATQYGHPDLAARLALSA